MLALIPVVVSCHGPCHNLVFGQTEKEVVSDRARWAQSLQTGVQESPNLLANTTSQCNAVPLLTMKMSFPQNWTLARKSMGVNHRTGGGCQSFLWNTQSAV